MSAARGAPANSSSMASGVAEKSSSVRLKPCHRCSRKRSGSASSGSRWYQTVGKGAVSASVASAVDLPNPAPAWISVRR
jgi:hypothetical protein